MGELQSSCLFVLGTLKRGQSNNFYLESQHFIGAASAEPAYRLLNCGWHPGLITVAEGGNAIQGEIWRVDETTLATLDEFEGVPKWFERLPIQIRDWAEPVVAYFFRGETRARRDWRGMACPIGSSRHVLVE